jgi:hypothetical protein
MNISKNKSTNLSTTLVGGIIALFLKRKKNIIRFFLWLLNSLFLDQN